MKKGFWKKMVCAGIGLMMALSLAACGGKEDENAALAKENVYRYQEVAFPNDFGDDYSFYGMSSKDGLIYMLLQVYHWNDPSYDGNYDNDIRLFTMKEDGTDLKTVQLQMPQTGDNTDGSDPAAPEGEFNPDNVWEYTGYGTYTIGGDGNIYGLKNYNWNYYDYENYENNIYIRKNYLVSWNRDGSFKGETELKGLDTDEAYYYVAGFTVDDGGNAQFILNGDGTVRMSIDAQGNASDMKPLSEETTDAFNYLDRLVDRGDGSFWVLYRDENDWTKEYYASYDVSTDTLGEKMLLPYSLTWSGYRSMVAGKTADLLYSTQEGLFALNRGDEESTKKMSYINSDLNIYGFDGLVELDEDRFLGVFSEAYDGRMRAGIFTYVKPEDIEDKTVLVLAGEYVGSDIKQRIVEFNRSSDKYRFVVKEYQSLNGPDDYYAGATQLNTDITTGGMPDILLTSGLPVDNYAAKGLLADINKFIEEDEELSKVEFMQNVFDSYSMNGKLYYVIPSFSVSTMVAKTSIVGDRNTWTMKEMQELMATMPEGTNLLTDVTRDAFFSTAMYYCGSDFVDIEAGKCDFDNEGFISLMEYAKTLPESLGDDYYDDYDWDKYETQYRDNKTILCSMYIGAIRNLNYTINGRFGEPVSYIGFPTDSGQGSYLNVDQSYAISEKSKHKDVAWEFLRYYLTDEYQSEINYMLPTQKKLFMERAQEATQRPYWIDSEGNKIEYDDTFWINDEEIILPPMSQEQVNATVAMIESVTKHPYVNDEILNIINEEMGAFFSGQKSAKEVAGLIQNRVQLYVDVNS